MGPSFQHARDAIVKHQKCFQNSYEKNRLGADLDLAWKDIENRFCTLHADLYEMKWCKKRENSKLRVGVSHFKKFLKTKIIDK